MGEIHELFGFALFLVWFAGATPDVFGAQDPRGPNDQKKIDPDRNF